MSLALELAHTVLAYVRRLPGGATLPYGQPIVCIPVEDSASGAEAAEGDIESQTRFRILFGDPWTFRCDIHLSLISGEGTLPERIAAAWRDENGKVLHRTWQTLGWCEPAFLEFLTRRLPLHSGEGADGSLQACDLTTRSFEQDFPLHFFGTPIPEDLVICVERDTKAGLTMGLLTDGTCVPVAGRSAADEDGTRYESVKVRLQGATYWCVVRNDPEKKGTVILCDGAFVEPVAGQAAHDVRRRLDAEDAGELLGAMTEASTGRRFLIREALSALLASG